MRRPIILIGDTQRAYAKQCIDEAKPMSVVTIKDPTRTNLQNARLHALVAEVSKQLKWHGMTLDVEDWKKFFMASLNSEMRLVPNEAGTGFVDLGRRTRNLTIGEMTDLMTVVEAFGARHGVTFNDQRSAT